MPPPRLPCRNRPAREERNVKIKEKEKKDRHTVTYNLGNETIIQPVSNSIKENAGLHTVLNIALGGFLCPLFPEIPGLLSRVLPPSPNLPYRLHGNEPQAIDASRQERSNRQTVEFSDQIATQTAQISALKKELEEYRSTRYACPSFPSP